MKPEDRSRNIDSLTAYIDHAIAEASEHGVGTNDSIITIAKTLKNHIANIKNGTADATALLEALAAQCSAGDNTRKRHNISVPSLASEISMPIFTPWKDSSSHPSSLVKLKTAGGLPVSLGKCLGHGGEGTVYKIQNIPGKVAKVYHEPLKAQKYNIDEKIRFMTEIKDVAYLDGAHIAAFPEELLYDSNGAFAGYIMPQITTSVKLFDVRRDESRRRLFPDLDYRGLIAIAYNLAEVTDHLHRSSVVIGDMNPSNICVYADGTVTLIDCDSFHIRSNTGKLFPCRVGLAEILAPELQTAKTIASSPISEKSDDFSLAIHIFRLLLNNADPFGFVSTQKISSHSHPGFDTIDGILNGECPYFRDLPDKKIPAWVPPLSTLPAYIIELFRRAFGYTAETALTSVNTRPSAAEWMEVLMKFYQEPLIQCKNDTFHWYLSALSACPFCSTNNKSLCHLPKWSV